MAGLLSPYAARPVNSKSAIVQPKGDRNYVTDRCHLGFGKWHAYHNTLPACSHGKHRPCFRASDHLTSWSVLHQMKKFLKIYGARQVYLRTGQTKTITPFMSKSVLLLTGCATSCSRWPKPVFGSSTSTTSNPFCRNISMFSMASSSSAAVSSKNCGLIFISICTPSSIQM